MIGCSAFIIDISYATQRNTKRTEPIIKKTCCINALSDSLAAVLRTQRGNWLARRLISPGLRNGQEVSDDAPRVIVGASLGLLALIASLL